MNEYDILQLDELSRRQKVKEDAEKIGRPSLTRRLGSGLLDLLFVAIVFVGLMVFAAVVLFESFGYADAVATINNIDKQSGLYVERDGMYLYIDNAYDNTKSIEDNYDLPISNYYSTDSRAVKADKMAEYNLAKEQSKLFDKDSNGKWTPKQADSDALRTFYQQQYASAVDFLAKDPTYVGAVNKTFQIMMSTIFVALLISTAIFYFAVPLLRKKGETLGQTICKVCLIDSRDNTPPKKTQVLLRSLAVVVINFFLPLTIYVVFSSLSLLPVIISMSVMCLTKYNKGIQDYISQTHVVLALQATIAFRKQQG